MSSEEQQREVGRLTLLRAEAQRQRALRAGQLADFGRDIQAAGSLLAAGSFDEARRVLNELIAAGGLAPIRDMAVECLEMGERIADYTTRLQAAGAENPR